MSNLDHANEWLKIAFEDVDSARFLFDKKHPKPLEIICYHCQQSAEKSLKGFLYARDLEIPRTHEVGLLCRHCAELDESFSAFLEDCEELEYFATRTRYPNHVEIEEHHAQKALGQALAIYTHVLEKLNLQT